MLAARGEGAKIVLVSACTTAAHPGRGAIQETDKMTHLATVIESVGSLPQVFRRVANGLARPGGFVCHLSVPTGLQTMALTSPMPGFIAAASPNRPDDAVAERCAALLTEGPPKSQKPFRTGDPPTRPTPVAYGLYAGTSPSCNEEPVEGLWFRNQRGGAVLRHQPCGSTPCRTLSPLPGALWIKGHQKHQSERELT